MRKTYPSVEHLVDHTTHTPHIRLKHILRLQVDLRCDVSGRPHIRRRRSLVRKMCEAEVGHDDVSLGVDEEVLGFDVTVNNPVAVEEGSGGDLVKGSALG